MKNLLKAAITLTTIGVVVKVVKNLKIITKENLIPANDHMRAEKMINHSLKTFSKKHE